MIELLVSLFLSACLGLWALLFAVNIPRDPMIRFAAGVVYFFTGSVLAMFLAIWFVATMLQYLLLLVLMIYFMIRKPKPVQGACLVAGVSLAPYLLIVPLSVIQAIQHRAHVLESLPLVSLADRLGKPPIARPIALSDDPLTRERKEDLASLESQLDREAPRHYSVKVSQLSTS